MANLINQFYLHRPIARRENKKRGSWARNALWTLLSSPPAGAVKFDMLSATERGRNSIELLTVVGYDHVSAGQGRREAQARGLPRLRCLILRFYCLTRGCRLSVRERIVNGNLCFQILQRAKALDALGGSSHWLATGGPKLRLVIQA